MMQEVGKLTARDYLHQMKTLKYQIRVKKLELDGLREDMQSLSSPVLGDKIKSSNNKNSIDDYIIKAEKLEADIRYKTAKKIDCLYDIHFKINALDDKLAVALLTDRYINNRSSDEVAKDINYAAAYVRKLTGEAIDLFVKKYGDVF